MLLGAEEKRWVAQLANFKYTIKYRPGRQNQNANALSRLPEPRGEKTPVLACRHDWRSQLLAQDDRGRKRMDGNLPTVCVCVLRLDLKSGPLYYPFVIPIWSCWDRLLVSGTSRRSIPYILVMTDLFPKYAFAVPTKDQSASTTAQASTATFSRRLAARTHLDRPGGCFRVYADKWALPALGLPEETYNSIGGGGSECQRPFIVNSDHLVLVFMLHVFILVWCFYLFLHAWCVFNHQFYCMVFFICICIGPSWQVILNSLERLHPTPPAQEWWLRLLAAVKGRRKTGEQQEKRQKRSRHEKDGRDVKLPVWKKEVNEGIFTGHGCWKGDGCTEQEKERWNEMPDGPPRGEIRFNAHKKKICKEKVNQMSWLGVWELWLVCVWNKNLSKKGSWKQA